MKKKLLPLLLAAGILIGVLGALYPIVASYLTTASYVDTVEAYGAAVTAELSKSEELFQRASSYNEELAFSGSFPAPDKIPEDYHSQLSITQDGMMGYIQIPKIDLQLPIYHGTSQEVLAKGVGHMACTSLPVGGTCSHAVLSAHSGMAKNPMFSNLEQLEVGDRVSLQVLDHELCYQVDELLTVLPHESETLVLAPDEDLLTLITCVPIGVNTHRLLVRCHRVEASAAQPDATPTSDAQLSIWTKQYIQYALIGLGAGGVLAAAFLLLQRLRKRRA